MIGHLVQAAWAPCPTLVLDTRYLPEEQGPLLAALTTARRWLSEAGAGHVLKIALIAPSSHPLFDLEYRFVQALPGGFDRFDLRGSCGHSVLASIVAAAESGMLRRLGRGDRVRVEVLNNGDQLVCDVAEADDHAAEFTVHLVQNPPRSFDTLLLTGEPVTSLDVDGDEVAASLVSAGNPYVFVDAATVGVTTRDELFADDPELFDRLVRIRRSAAAHLGWEPDGAFPKIAVTRPQLGKIAVRAVSVPTWHPRFALTGAACLGAAAGIPGTIPWLAVRRSGDGANVIELDTPGGSTSTRAVGVRSPDGVRQLGWVTVSGRKVVFLGSFLLEPLAALQFKEVAECLSVLS